jgi:Tol biopolymer transport system component
MNTDGSARRKLTNHPKYGDSDPVWSANGRKIAFLRKDDIFVMNADGSGQTNLSNTSDTPDDWGEESLAWSLDGTTLAFTIYPLSGCALRNIWLMNADGSGQRRLTNRGDVQFASEFASARLDGLVLLAADGRGGRTPPYDGTSQPLRTCAKAHSCPWGSRQV